MSSGGDHGAAPAAESADVAGMRRVGGARSGLGLEQMTNSLLREVGISTKYITLGELQESASSMFVAIFEALYDVRLEGVVRKPTKSSDYVHNAQLVLDALSQSLKGVNVGHITAHGICSGDVVEIQHLVEIFRSIRALMKPQRAEGAAVPASPLRVDSAGTHGATADAGGESRSGAQSEARLRELRRQEAEVRARRQAEEQAGRRRAQTGSARRPSSAKRASRGGGARKRRAQTARRRGRGEEALFTDEVSEIDGDQSLASSDRHSERELMDELSRHTGAGFSGVEYPSATVAAARGGYAPQRRGAEEEEDEEKEDGGRRVDPLARLAGEFPALWHQLRRAKSVREANERREKRPSQQATAVRAIVIMIGVSLWLQRLH